MRVFLVSCIAALVIAIGAQFVLSHFVAESSERAYSEPSTRP